MRPTRLELSGFTAFREPAEVDFGGAELFALVGPTGSGKSSVIDAMCFALYGCVPRYGDRRLVAPAISQGRNEARVRLDFSVGGTDYTAVRVVRRTKTGATTPEARLERLDGDGGGGGEVVASGADEVTEAVEHLLGLSFEHFTTCVVLPQGEFARFLHDKARDRQQLLATLLELTVYEEMGRAARQRAKEATNKRELLDDQLERLAFATPEARAEVAGRIDTLAALKATLEAELPRLDELAAAAGDARRLAGEAEGRAVLLERLDVPDGIADLGRALAEASEAQQRAATAAADVDRALHEAEEAQEAAGSPVELERAKAAHGERATVAKVVAKGEAALVAATAACEERSGLLARAEAVEADARTALDRARLQHRAHDLAVGLVAGEACPVCRQQVLEVPAAVAVPDVDDATAAVARATDAVAAARRAAQEADTERARIVAKLEDQRARLATLDAAVAAHPDAEAIDAALAEVAMAADAVLAARAAAKAARAAVGEAETALAAIRQREVDARRVFDEARDRVAALGPPAAERGDLAADWSALVAWARQRAPELRAEAERSTTAAAAAEQERAALGERLAAACRDAQVATDGNLLYACADALIRAETELERIDKAVAERDDLLSRTAALKEQEQVAATLGRHLDAKGFEKWVLDEALDGLVAGATVVLRELSGGQYSLTLDAKTSNFMVVDHRNADEVRSARTLSGGETFLASLALALALAEMTARGAAPLDAIFLDEGFGTLDADTLDTVAAAIEELGARGRMVGLVSHVQELADRVPVRFEVRKGPQTSTVEKVFA